MTGQVCLATKQLVRAASTTEGDWALALSHVASALSDLADVTSEASSRLEAANASTTKGVAEEMRELARLLRAVA